jgi:hypothetical protein
MTHRGFLVALSLASTADPIPESLARVPISLEQGLVRVPVSVAGSAPFHLVLDTGMPTRGILLYASERVDALGLDFSDGEAIAGAGGSGAGVSVRVAEGARIQIGSLAIGEVSVTVLRRPPGFAGAGDGVIGNELFERYVLRVDAGERRLDLFDSASFEPDRESTVVPLRLRNRAPFVDVRVSVGAGEPIPCDVALDLGARHSLWLNERPDGRLAAPDRSIAVRLGRGLSGEVLGRVGRVSRLEIGGFAFENVVAIFPGPEHRNPGGVDFRDGFVGSQLLMRFVVTFDYARERMLLRPSERLAEPFEYDMTGMVFDSDAEGRLVVNSILPGSPAAEAKIEKGDILLAVDGEVVAAGRSSVLERAFRTDGAEVHLRLMRGSDAFDKTLRLRRLL